MKRLGSGLMLVTKPEGDMIQREIRIVYEDRGGGLFEVEIVGESPLKNYRFAIRQADLKRIRDSGTVIDG